MNALMERFAETPEQWRAGCTAVYRAGQSLIADGKRAKLALTAEEDSLTLRQYRFIHGPILQQISEQVAPGGVKFDRKAWKIQLKDLFFPDAFEMVQAPFVRDAKTGHLRPSKRKVPRKKDKSLTHITGKLRSEFIDWVLAYAAVEWGVVFQFDIDERDACRYQPPKRRTAPGPAAQPSTAQRKEAVPA